MTAVSLIAVNLEPYISTWPYVLAGLGVALLVFMVMTIRQSWNRDHEPPPLPYLGPDEQTRDSAWQEQNSYTDRRRAARRSGHPVRVHVTSPAFKNRVEAAFVLDRSTGGLRLALGQGVASGITLQVRADDAPDDSDWVTVTVRNCRNAGQHYELGCEFDRTPPWNVLLLFG